MATTINAGTTTGTSLAITPDTTGAMVIQTSGSNAISISSSQAVTIAATLAVTGTTTFTGIPSGPTASVGTSTTQLATTAFVQAAIPSGVILLWSGSVASIPSGWLLCNGSSGTPDLRDRFIVGAGSTYAVAATGGSADATLVSHTHTFSGTSSGQSAGHTHGITDPGHSHTAFATVGFSGGDNSGVQVGNALSYENPTTRVGVNSATTGITGTGGTSNDHTHTYSGTTSTSGSSATNANLPPYYALAYIMKA